MIGSKIAKPAKNAVHPDSALTFGFYGGDHCRGAGDGERWPLKVSRRLYILIAYVLAILATVIGWSQSLNYKSPPLIPLALWFPLIVITGANEFQAVALSLVQFPLFATAFAFGIRRWSVGRVLTVVGITYALSAIIGFAIVRSG